MIFERNFREFRSSLNEEKIDFLIVGGYAGAFHGEPRATSYGGRRTEAGVVGVEGGVLMLAAAVQDLSLDFDYAPIEIVDPQIAARVHVGDVGRHLGHAYIRVFLVLIESLEQPGLRVVEAFRELLFRLANPRIDELADFFDEFPLEPLKVRFQLCPRHRGVSIAFHTMPILPCLESLMSISLKAGGHRALSAFLYLYLRWSAQAVWFEPNQGQVHRSVEFLARSGGYLYFGRNRMAVRDVRMDLTSATSKAVGDFDEPTGGISSFIGRTEDDWHTGIPNYAHVRYRNVYSRIDLMCYGHQRDLEYDFILRPGADPSQIRVAYNKPVRVDA